MDGGCGCSVGDGIRGGDGVVGGGGNGSCGNDNVYVHA